MKKSRGKQRKVILPGRVMVYKPLCVIGRTHLLFADFGPVETNESWKRGAADALARV